PEDEDAHRGQWQVVALDPDRSEPEAADPWSKDEDCSQRDPAADRVHDGRAGEIHEAEIAQPAPAPALKRPVLPGPVAEDRICDRGHEDRQSAVAAERHALG